MVISGCALFDMSPLKFFFKGRRVNTKATKIINRQQFDVAIQAAIGAKILARETVKALRKMFWRMLWGDITRKRKLLEKQKRVKKE